MGFTDTGGRQAAILAAVLASLARTCPAADLAARIEERLAAEAKPKQFSGSVLVAQGGEVLFRKGYGMANLEHDVPNTPKTKFRLGSVTKQFTAMAATILQEQGKLSVQDPIDLHVSDPPAAWQGIIIRHLLTHTSGIPDFTRFRDYGRRMVLPSSVAQTILRFRNRPLEFTPGQRYSYCNSGYILLGHIIEKASGKKYREFVRESIFDPLGMKDSGYDRTSRILTHRAAGYAFWAGNLVNARYLDMSIPHAAGALYSTVDDLYLWDQALYTEKLVTKKSLDEMFTPFRSGYAYGWQVSTRHGRKCVSHAGAIPGFSAAIIRFPEGKACVVVLSNLMPTNARRIGSDLSALLFAREANARTP